MSLPIVTTSLLHIEVFSQRCGLHPDLIRRLVALGLVEPVVTHGEELWFPTGQIARVARMQRLRGDFSLNYTAVGLVMDLLDRIEQLERSVHPDNRPIAP